MFNYRRQVKRPSNKYHNVMATVASICCFRLVDVVDRPLECMETFISRLAEV